jgi:hypothetical protein
VDGDLRVPSARRGVKSAMARADSCRVSRVFGFLIVLGVLAASGYTFVDKARTGDLDPVRAVDEAALRGELASAQYVLGIVAGQLHQVHALESTYDAQLNFDKFPLVTLARADQNSYCLEFKKTHTFFLAGPGGAVAQGTC